MKAMLLRRQAPITDHPLETAYLPKPVPAAHEVLVVIRACAVCPGEVSTPILDNRPIPVSEEDRARMVQSEDMGDIILFLAQLPAHVCINELTVSPTWNRGYVRQAQAVQAL